MVWLEAIEIEERAEEVGNGKSESTLEVGNENHPLTGLRGGGKLIAGSAANHVGADPARLVQPLDVVAADLGAFPAARGSFVMSDLEAAKRKVELG